MTVVDVHNHAAPAALLALLRGQPGYGAAGGDPLRTDPAAKLTQLRRERDRRRAGVDPADPARVRPGAGRRRGGGPGRQRRPAGLRRRCAGPAALDGASGSSARVVFLTGPNTVLLPTLIFQQWETGQQLGPVAALNILSVVVSAGALLLGRLLLLRTGRRRRVPTPAAAVG
jgi:hypothetical protein